MSHGLIITFTMDEEPFFINRCSTITTIDITWRSVELFNSMLIHLFLQLEKNRVLNKNFFVHRYSGVHPN